MTPFPPSRRREWPQSTCIARLELYAAAGADMLFPTMVGPAELAEVQRRLAKPLMIVNNREGQLARERHRAAGRLSRL